MPLSSGPLDIDTAMEGPSSPRTCSSLASSPPPNASSEYSYASSDADNSQHCTENESTRDGEDPPEPSQSAAPQDEEEKERRISQLQHLLKQSTAYSTIIKQRMDEEKEKQAELLAARSTEDKVGTKRGPPEAHEFPKGKKRRGINGEAVAVHEVSDEQLVFQQPALITGATLKPYQLEGLQWMVSLDQNGISGILADEMGLGKTLQTISFSAYLREHGNVKPFLVVCPLSVLHNWEAEYKKFAPEIPVCIYHGPKDERAELRRTIMAIPGLKFNDSKRGKRSKSKKPKRKPGRPPKAKPKPPVGDGVILRRSGRPRKHHPVIIESDTDDDEPKREASMEVDEGNPEEEQRTKEAEYTAAFPVVLTTYDIIIRDRAHLQHYEWGYIVVDEGHRLKNLDCKLMREIKKYSSAGRMILTGTPLHNNLGELWSLLNFILPSIFEDLETFQEWFNLPDLHSTLPTEQSHQIISSLHAILKPFLLRRMKVDVELNLPPKKEYVLYCPLSMRQREAYDKVLDGTLRSWLIKGGTSGETAQNDEAKREEVEAEEESEDDGKDEKRRVSKRQARAGRKSYAVDGDDDAYFDMVENGEVGERGVIVVKTSEEKEAEQARAAKEHQVRTKVRQVNNMKLQNAVMQLRKVCSHPFLFDWPIDPKTHDLILGEELVNASGKMMVLDRLLKELFERKHKVLIFSQFKIMLDIIQDWAEDYMGWRLCRIDGETKPDDRRDQMQRFQTAGDAHDAPNLFLLSTRAGGLGINLTAADTVIFYDQDWNPQMDVQAQDRAHRIGQTKPVLIFRLVSAHTIETKILQRASEKRQLEALVIAKGKFKMPALAATLAVGAHGATKKETMAEMAASLMRLEGEKIEVVPETKEGKKAVLSDEDLEMLLDRRPEVFDERGEGWISSRGAKTTIVGAEAGKANLDHGSIGSGTKASFAVYQAPVDEGNEIEALAGNTLVSCEAA